MPAWLLPAILGGLGGLGVGAAAAGSKGTKTQLTPDKTEGQLGVDELLSGYFQKYLPKYQPGTPYTGKLSAEMSPYEGRSLDFLSQYLDQPLVGSDLQLGRDELRKTMTDQYDPRSSTYYQGLRSQAERDLQDQIDTQRRSQGYRGTYFTEGAARDESRTRDTYQSAMNQLLGGLYEKERERRFQAIPYSLQFEQAVQGAPLARAAAAQQFGALPRTLEQADLERQYQEFQRQQGQLEELPKEAINYFGQPVTYGAKTLYGPSAFSQIMGSVLPAASQFLGAYYGGGAGAAGGSVQQGFGYNGVRY